ncbi:MAG: HAD family hydrolase [Rhodospirillales bacterium]|nr:HAD family hydrolase [Rhodospirillales bacterium]
MIPPAAPPPPAYVLYDWDNTLVDAWAGVAAALNAAFAAFGLPAWSLEETRARVRTSLRDSFPPLFGPGWTRARDIFYATLEACHLHHVTPLPGTEALLTARPPALQGVVSNKTGKYLRAEVVHLGWQSRFATVVGAGDAAADKPDPAPLRLALEQMGVKPGPAVWYVGDTASDMQAARAAGLTAVLLGDASHDGGIDLAAPDLHFLDAASLIQGFSGTGSGACLTGRG